MRWWVSRERLRREAAEWHVKQDRGLTASERDEFARWWADSDDHRVAFNQSAAVMTESLPQASPIVRGRSLDAAFPAQRRRQGRWIAAGATAALAVAAFSFADPLSWMIGPSLQSVMLAAGPLGRQVRLKDGSSVVLGPSSSIKIDLLRNERRAELRAGHARLMIAADPRVFNIRAGNAERSLQEGTADVALVDGVGTIALRPGAMAAEAATSTHDGQAKLERPAASNLSPSKAPYEFASLPLDQVAAMVNADEPARRLQIDPAIAALRVSGRYQREDVEGLAHSLAITFGLTVSDNSDGAIQLRRPQK